MLSARSIAITSRNGSASCVGRPQLRAKPVHVCQAVGKTDLTNAVAEKTGLSKKDASAFITAFIDTIEHHVAEGERVTLIGFGTFERRERSARVCRNPKTGEAINVPATKSPAFKAATAFKDRVNGKKKE